MQLNKISQAYFISLLFLAGISSAQKDAQYVYDGNDLYRTGKIPESSAKYARALELNPNNRKANFNLGNSLYKNAIMVKAGALTMPESATMKPDSLAGLIFDKAAENFA